PSFKFLDLRFNDVDSSVPSSIFDKQLDALFLNGNRFQFGILTNLGNSPVSLLVFENNIRLNLVVYFVGHSWRIQTAIHCNQVADKIRRHEQVSVIERTNLRYLAELPQKVDIATLDFSFISILLGMPAVVGLMKDEATLVTLV
ncbi:Leucine-rich repeat extensin-like protein 2, partial [Linum grandiflorum]